MPKLLTTPFASEATSEYRTDVQNATGAEPNSATYEQGFPPLTMEKIANGGKPPKGSDLNGVLYDITDNLVSLTKGARYGFNEAYATAIGGYPLGAVLRLENGVEVESEVDSNSINPNVDMTGWKLAVSDKGIVTWSWRTQREKNKERVSVLDFYKSSHKDHTQAIIDGDSYCEENSLTLYFPSGTYYASESLTKSSKTKWVGDGKPNFNITVGSDDKRFMRPNQKHLLGGSNIIWTGSQTDVITLNRDDRFASFGYMLKTEYFEPNQISGLGLICDVDCFDSEGNLTTYETDNRASYDVGLVIDNAMDCKLHQVAVFGYFGKKKALVTIVRNTDASNPDYNFHFDCTYFGGVALIGYQSSPNQGLSGSLFNGCSLYDQTYHNRSTTKADDYIDQDVIYIDGQAGESNAINGHMFVGGCIRSTCPEPLKLNRCDGLSITNVTTECTLNSKYTGQTLKYITGTTNTKRVTLAGNRIASWYLRLRQFANEITGPFVCDEDGQGTSYLVKNSKGIRYGSCDQLNNDPAFQFSNNFSSFTNGLNIRYRIDQDDLQFNFNGSTKLTLDNAGNITPFGRVKKIIGSGSRENRTISNGAITLTGASSYIAVAGEGASADDLTTVSGGTIGDIIVLVAYSASQPITVKNSASIRLNNSTDFSLATAFSTLTLMFNGTNWIELARSVNS